MLASIKSNINDFSPVKSNEKLVMAIENIKIGIEIKLDLKYRPASKISVKNNKPSLMNILNQWLPVCKAAPIDDLANCISELSAPSNIE